VQDLPTHAELVEAVREFLEKDVFPALEGRTKFHTRVAMNVLGIVQRELTQGAHADAEERARLLAVLGRSDESDVTLLDLNRELSAQLRDGRLDPRRRDVVDHLRATLRDKLAIANPDYLPE
jgi:hypothetical protein